MVAMFGIKELIYRYRHNRGFGVQSPSAFHFVTSVLKDTHPYYAYPTIERLATGRRRASQCKRLFRIANYLRSQNIVMLAPHKAAAYALAAARKNIPVTLLESADDNYAEAFDNIGTLGLLYVGECDNCASVVDEAIKHAAFDSAVVVEGIYSSREKEKWWQTIKQNPSVCVTFDLYSMGILFFDKKYKKQHYTLKM